MSKLTIGIVEDEMIIAEALSEMLKSIGYEIPEPASNYQEALLLIENEKPDLLLLDINLSSQLTGIDIAKTITEKYHLPYIFLTANSDSTTLEQAKTARPMAYLSKPITRDQLYTAIEIAIHNFNHSNTKTVPVNTNENNRPRIIFVKDGYAFRKIDLQEISHLESDANYVTIHNLDGSKLMTRSTLSAFSEQLDPAVFTRVHRSFVVNIHHINSINAYEIVTQSGKIPVGKNYKEDFFKTMGIIDSPAD